MSFNPNNQSIKKVLQEGNTKNQQEIKMPMANNQMEKTHPYTVTLQPSVRKKLDEIAKERGFKSSSSFLNELIKCL